MFSGSRWMDRRSWVAAAVGWPTTVLVVGLATSAPSTQFPGLALFVTLFYWLVVSIALAAVSFLRLPERVEEQRTVFLARCEELGFEAVEASPEFASWAVIATRFPVATHRSISELLVRRSGARSKIAMACRKNDGSTEYLFRRPSIGALPEHWDSDRGVCGAILDLRINQPDVIIVGHAAALRPEQRTLGRARTLERDLPDGVAIYTNDQPALTALLIDGRFRAACPDLRASTVELRGNRVALVSSDPPEFVLSNARRLAAALALPPPSL